jgi:hypothetical protein
VAETPSPARQTRTARVPSQWLRAALTERLPYKIAALVLAIALWVLVPNQQQTVRVSLELTLDPSMILAAPPPAIHAQISGRVIDLLRMTEPCVVHVFLGGGKSDSATVDLSPDDVELPRGAAVTVRDVQPRRFTLHFVPSPSNTTPLSAKSAPRRDSLP